MSAKDIANKALEQGEGVLRLAPNWVPRSFCVPGRRIKLHPDDYYALGGERHEGTAIFYGRLVEDPDVLASIDHPVYGTFAELDGGIPPDQVERFAEALRAAGVENDIHVNDDVNHGFWLWVDRDPDTATAPAADAWRRLKDYLARVLG